MARSLKKGPYIDPKLMKKIEKLNDTNQKKVVKTWARKSTIPPEFVGHTIPHFPRACGEIRTGCKNT